MLHASVNADATKNRPGSAIRRTPSDGGKNSSMPYINCLAVWKAKQTKKIHSLADYLYFKKTFLSLNICKAFMYSRIGIGLLTDSPKPYERNLTIKSLKLVKPWLSKCHANSS